MQYEEHVNVQNGWPKQPTITTSWKINSWFTSNSPSHLISRNLIWTKPWASKCECSKGVLSHPIIFLKLALYPTYPHQTSRVFWRFFRPASLYPTAPQKTRFSRFVWCCHSTRSWYFGGGKVWSEYRRKVQQWFEGSHGMRFFAIFSPPWDEKQIGMPWDEIFIPWNVFQHFGSEDVLGHQIFHSASFPYANPRGSSPSFRGRTNSMGEQWNKGPKWLILMWNLPSYVGIVWKTIIRIPIETTSRMESKRVFLVGQILPWNRPSKKENIVFQPAFFSGIC